jgi:MscS family membrane protein
MKKYFALGAAIVAIAVISAQLEALPDWAAGLQKAQPWLSRAFLRVHVWQWIGLAILAIVALLMGLVAMWLSVRLTRIRDHFAPVPMSDSTRFAIGRSAGIVLGALFAELLLSDLTLAHAFQGDLENLFNSLALFGAAWLLYAGWDATCDTLASKSVGHERAERLLVPMMRKLVRAGIVVCGILAGVALFGGTRTIATLAGTLGIGGLVVALAGKDSVENLIGSFTIMFDMPLAIGDWVKTNGLEGTVEQINLRSTRLRTSQDTVIHLPNANLIRASVENFGSRRFRLLRLNLRLSYDCQKEDIDSYVAALGKFMSTRSEIAQDGTNIALTDPQEQSLGLLVECHLEVDTYALELQARHRLLDEALRLRTEHRIAFAAPPRPKDVAEEPVPAPPAKEAKPN